MMNALALPLPMDSTDTSLWNKLFDFSDYGQLVALLTNSILAGAVLSVVGGLIAVFVMQRDMAFAVHGISELSFSGGAAGLLFGIGVVKGALVGSLIAAALIGLMGSKARDRNSIIAVLMPFGLGLGILFLSLAPGRTANKFGLLTGQIVAIDDPRLDALTIISVIVTLGLLAIWRPLTFASMDPDVAEARGVPTRFLSLAFMMLLGLAVAVSVQIVGAFLVLSILVTPAAAAMRLSSSPVVVPLLSVLFAFISLVGGIMLSLGASVPVSPYVTTISFLIYLIANGVWHLRNARQRRAVAATEAAEIARREAEGAPATH
ncbi:metal ABC transporter permease [Actinomyces polynesiensis]|uniref:metal ABC transporter permease n=1 Tax=Actinomyces polynesiensis TaxID=1325934 RepID=UPI000B11A8CB|nr:metal ABC transporter permease [Actinomyces polynesiensis]